MSYQHLPQNYYLSQDIFLSYTQAAPAQQQVPQQNGLYSYSEAKQLPSIYVPSNASMNGYPVAENVVPDYYYQQQQAAQPMGYGNYYTATAPVYQYGHVQKGNYQQPILPASINDQASYQGKRDDAGIEIDYSQLVSYTISPPLKRRRRSRQTDLESEQLYPCNVCNKVFQKPYNLKSHMKTHSNEKPYSCSVCSKTFARSHDKRRHELLHGGEKTFKCEGFLKNGTSKWGCGKRFARADALSRHFRTETGWLCIKPLMDEAKGLDINEHPMGFPHLFHSHVTQGLPLPQMVKAEGDGAYDSSGFIRKLIQSK